MHRPVCPVEAANDSYLVDLGVGEGHFGQAEMGHVHRPVSMADEAEYAQMDVDLETLVENEFYR